MDWRHDIPLTLYVGLGFAFFLTLGLYEKAHSNEIYGASREVASMQVEEAAKKANKKVASLSQKNNERLKQLQDLPNVKSTDPELVLVNREHRQDEPANFTQAHTQEGFIYNALAKDAYEKLIQAAAKDNIQLVCVSAFRSQEDQARSIKSQTNAYLKEGLNAEEAKKKVDQYIAPANATEHLTGLAFDFVDSAWQASGKPLIEEYQEEESAKWLAVNAPKYGFVLRYIKGKGDITNVDFEPWHFRYVGVEVAQYLTKHNMTLEEFIDLLKEKEALKAGKQADHAASQSKQAESKVGDQASTRKSKTSSKGKASEKHTRSSTKTSPN